MAPKLMDMETWELKEFYEHFISEVVCIYSSVINIDITNLTGQKLYPTMIWLLTKAVNDMPEFRTVLTPDGPGIYDDIHPMYTVFNQENKHVSGIWSYFSAERTQTGKAIARQGPNFKDERPKKFTPEQIALALPLLDQGKTYRQITTMTGISKSTLI